MMLRGCSKVYRFTLAQQCKNPRFRITTLLTAIILFLIPVIIMPLVESSAMKREAEREWETPEPPAYHGASGIASGIVQPDDSRKPQEASLVLLVVSDEVKAAGMDFHFLAEEGIPDYAGAQVICCADLQEASDAARQNPQSLLLVLEMREEELVFCTLLPDASALTEEDAGYLAGVTDADSEWIILRSKGLSDAEAMDILKEWYPDSEDETPTDILLMILRFAIPYLNAFLVYMLVLVYGQNTANSVMMEKTSKLMDLFLITIDPRAMVVGKTLAICTAALGQVALWILALLAGYQVGCSLVLSMNPASTMAIIQITRLFGLFARMFTPQAIILSIVMIGAGFLLFSSLASIGGALAGKPEDLSTTNMLFTLILVASFLVTMNATLSNGMGTSGVIGPAWWDYVPFTSILITPSRVLLGDLTIVDGLISLGIVLVFALVLMLLSGKVYRIMAFYKGKAPRPSQLMQLLRTNRRSG